MGVGLVCNDFKLTAHNKIMTPTAQMVALYKGKSLRVQQHNGRALNCNLSDVWITHTSFLKL